MQIPHLQLQDNLPEDYPENEPEEGHDDIIEAFLAVQNGEAAEILRSSTPLSIISAEADDRPEALSDGTMDKFLEVPPSPRRQKRKHHRSHSRQVDRVAQGISWLIVGAIVALLIAVGYKLSIMLRWNEFSTAQELRAWLYAPDPRGDALSNFGTRRQSSPLSNEGTISKKKHKKKKKSTMRCGPDGKCYKKKV